MSVRKILVIDDQKEIRENLVDILRAEGYDADAATDGEDALVRLSARVPDLILCDAMMPRLDGFGLVERIRSNPKFASVPFVFLTAKSETADFRRGMDLGADDYLTKPWTIDHLLRVIDSRLRRQDEIAEWHREEMARLGDEIRRRIPSEMLEPLRGIISFSDVLARHCGTLGRDYVTELAHDIGQSSRDLRRAIENFEFLMEFVTAAHPDSGAPFAPVTAIVRDTALGCARERGREEDLKLAVEDLSVTAASRLPGKLLSELLDNAFGFSRSGTQVEVGLRREGDTLILTVADHGCGMMPGQTAEAMAGKEHPSDVFTQTTRGTGLVVCRAILQRLGAHWQIDSRFGEGTTVEVRLPVTQNQVRPSLQPAAAAPEEITPEVVA